MRRLAGNLKWKWVVAALLLCGVVATFETMTIAFFLTTFTLAAIIVAIRRRDPAQLAVLGVAIAACGLAFALSLAPNLRYWAANGTDKDTGRRVPTEQEAFGLPAVAAAAADPDPPHPCAARGADGAPAGTQACPTKAARSWASSARSGCSRSSTGR